jgi:hypothetical protein
MRLTCALLATVLLVSCGGGTPAPAPTAPNGLQTPPPNTYIVSGTVRDDKGVPVADASVFVGCGACKTGPGFSATTNGAGFYSGRIREGTWDLFVSKPGYTRLSQYGAVVVTTDTTRDLTLMPGVRVSGRTFEEGVGSLTGVRIEVIGGPDDGASYTTRGPGVENAWSLSLLPGTHRLRASKDGYDAIERTITAMTDANNIDFTLKWAYGSCLRSVTPVFFNGYASKGGDETVTVDVNPGRTWTATPDQPWLSVTSSAAQDVGRLSFRVHPHPVGADKTRTGAIMIRCSASEGQNVWITQKPDCQITLSPHADTPQEFSASGGTGKLRVVTGLVRCEWRAESQADWIHTVGVSSWYASYDNLHFIVSENRTGAPRTGTLLVGETVWTIKQR